MRTEEKDIQYPESVMVRDEDELYRKLNVGMEQIKAGEVIDADLVMARLKAQYGFSGE